MHPILALALLTLFATLVLRFFIPAVLRGDILHALGNWIGRARPLLKRLTRYGTELGGYVHDTAVSFWIDFTLFSHNSGTWTMTVGAVANTYMTRRTAAAATSITRIPIVVPQNSVAQKGSYLKSIDIWFEYSTAAPTTLDALIWKNVLPADTAAIAAATAIAFSYDTGHDTAGERDNVDQHKMTLTLTTPVWLDDDDLIFVELTSVNAATTLLDFYGARANVTLRL